MPIPQAVEEPVGDGRFGGYNALVEGSPEERRKALEEHLRERRVDIARRRWRALSPDEVQFRRFQRRDLVVETGRGPKGKVYMPMTEPVWPHGDTRTTLNEDLIAAVIVGHDVVAFLAENDLGIATVGDFEQMQEDVAYLDSRREERKQATVDKHEAELRDFRAKQPLTRVLLEDIEGRPLPTVRAAFESVRAAGGKFSVTGGRLAIDLPDALAPEGNEDAALRKPLLDACLVLAAAGDVVAAVLESSSSKNVLERMPDRAVDVAGGLA